MRHAIPNKLIANGLQHGKITGTRVRVLKAVLGLGLLCLGASAFAVHAYYRQLPILLVKRTAELIVPQPSVPMTATQPGTPPYGLEVEVITIRPTGFEPKEITRPIGRFGIAVENRSGLQGIKLRLDQKTGARLREVQMPRNRHDWKDVIDLPPGLYVLTEANHPEWVCKISITNK